MRANTRHLNKTQLQGLIRAGDILIPGDEQLPSFSRSESVMEADRVFDHMSEADRDGLKLLLGIFRFLPRWFLRLVFFLTTKHRFFPGPAGAALRMISLGVKGTVMTLYYSDLSPNGSIYKAIQWDARIVERETDPASVDEQTHLEKVTTPGEDMVAETTEPELPRPQDAFRRARTGFQSLGRLPLSHRAQRIADLRRVVLDRREEIAGRIQADTGKSRSDALISEVFGVLDNLAWLERHGQRCLKESKVHTPLALMGKRSRIWFEPLGTVLIISPWNYPFYQAIVPIASALLAGDTVVYKPSEWTPLEGLVEDIMAQAQVAPNWVQVVYGDGAVGAALIDQRPDKIFFTGSSRTGKKILSQASQYLIPVELELGGKDPMIVFEDANIERAAAGAAWGAFTNTGQSCTSVERLYVQETIYDRFKSALIQEVGRIKQAIDLEGDADIGAMTTDFQVTTVHRQVEDARTKGALFLTGQEWDGSSKMIPPMVIERVSDDMLVAREETFGPLLPLFKFKSEEEVIKLANDSDYGLSASIWSREISRARRVSRAIATGNVSINNVMLTEGNPALPFGGVKKSGFGRYKGEYGLHGFCNLKSVIIDKDSGKIEANWYPYTKGKYRLFSQLMVHLFSGGIASFVRFTMTGFKLERYSTRIRKPGAKSD